MKIAVACCGLGHIHRGIEVWAKDLASALNAKGIDVTLFKGGGKPELPYEVVVPCIKRGSTIAKLLTGWKLPGMWRTAFGSPYKMESHTFARNLVPYLKDDYDIVHLQDPVVADLLLKARKESRIKPEVLLANGTEEPPDALAAFDYLQELDAFGIEMLKKAGYENPGRYAIPNFVDTGVFMPGDKKEARRQFGLPESAYVVLSVGAVQRSFKRMDYLINEFGSFRARANTGLLVLAGARTEESAELEKMAREKTGENVLVLENVDHSNMPQLYRAADVFVFCVTHGIYGIALAEAAATGLPCIVHDWKRVKWVAGPKAAVIDMTQDGALAQAIEELSDSELRRNISGPTRKWAEEKLAKNVIIDQYIEMYREIIDGKKLAK